MVWLSVIVDPVNVPKWSEASATPDKVIRWSTSRDALVWSLDVNFVSTAVSNAWNASWIRLLAGIVDPVKGCIVKCVVLEVRATFNEAVSLFTGIASFSALDSNA